MAYRIRSDVLRSNERVKLASSIAANLGTALFATALGRWFLTGFDAYVILWIITAVLLAWSGWYMLLMLEMEE